MSRKEFSYYLVLRPDIPTLQVWLTSLDLNTFLAEFEPDPKACVCINKKTAKTIIKLYETEKLTYTNYNGAKDKFWTLYNKV